MNPHTFFLAIGAAGLLLIASDHIRSSAISNALNLLAVILFVAAFGIGYIALSF